MKENTKSHSISITFSLLTYILTALAPHEIKSIMHKEVPHDDISKLCPYHMERTYRRKQQPKPSRLCYVSELLFFLLITFPWAGLLVWRKNLTPSTLNFALDKDGKKTTYRSCQWEENLHYNGKMKSYRLLRTLVRNFWKKSTVV